MIDLIITTGDHSTVKDFMGPRGIAFEAIIPRRPVGKPTVMTKDVLRKLEEAFMHSFTDREACVYADIGLQTLYDYCKAHPEYSEQKEAFKLMPNLATKKELVQGIKGNLDQSRWWATHKMADEFMPASKIQMEGDVTTRQGMTPEVEKVIEEMNVKMREALAAPHKPT